MVKSYQLNVFWISKPFNIQDLFMMPAPQIPAPPESYP